MRLGDKRAQTASLRPIDELFVAHVVDDAERVAVGEALVLVAPGGQATVLNPTGSLIWDCLDGEVSLGELATELSEELGVDRELIAADVLTFVRQLGEAGLLEGVGVLAESNEREQPGPLEMGEELDDFTLADFDGTARTLSDSRGRDLLVVNWSPTCGFCTMIAP